MPMNNGQKRYMEALETTHQNTQDALSQAGFSDVWSALNRLRTVERQRDAALKDAQELRDKLESQGKCHSEPDMTHEAQINNLQGEMSTDEHFNNQCQIRRPGYFERQRDEVLAESQRLKGQLRAAKRELDRETKRAERLYAEIKAEQTIQDRLITMLGIIQDSRDKDAGYIVGMVHLAYMLAARWRARRN